MAGTKMKRSIAVDTLRGIACILLVLFHTVGDTSSTGLRIPEENWLAHFNVLLGYFRMPLFAFLSGFVYAFRPYQGNAPAFLKGKVRRLLLPLLTVGTAFAILQGMTPGANSGVENWWLLHIEPVGHFWFLESLFLIFLFVALLEHLGALSNPASFTLVWALSALQFVFFDAPHWFSINGAVYLLPFFLAGLACKRFSIEHSNMRLLAAGALLWGVTVVLLRPEPMKYQGALGDITMLALGLSSAFLLLRSGWQSRFLAYIGVYSFPIFLLHVFFTAASRIGFSRSGVHDIYALLGLGLVAGIAGPIFCAAIIGRSERLNLWLLGSTARIRPALDTRRPSRVASKAAR